MRSGEVMGVMGKDVVELVVLLLLLLLLSVVLGVVVESVNETGIE